MNTNEAGPSCESRIVDNFGGLNSMRTLLFLTAVVMAGCASTPLEAIVTEQKLVGWKVASQHDQGRGKGTIVELIPSSEAIDKWQQLATIQFLEGERRTPHAFMDALETSMKTRCPSNAEWRVTAEEAHSVAYEWRIHSCAGQDDQTEIARILQGNDGLHRIAYAEKGETMKPENREFWTAALRQAYVAKGDVGKPITLHSQ